MNIEQVALQLGIAGLIVWVGYKIVQEFLERWSKVEERKQAEDTRRTAVFEKGMETLLERVERHATNDLQSHGELSSRIARFEGKLDEVLINLNHRLTPAQGHGIARVTPVHGHGVPPIIYEQPSGRYKKKDDDK